MATINVTREEGEILITAVQARRLQLIDLGHMKDADKHERLFYKLIKSLVAIDRKRKTI